MAMTTNPFVLKDTSVQFRKDSDPELIEYRCQMTAASLVPSDAGGGGGNTLSTFCYDYTDSSVSPSKWALELSGFQSFADAQDFSMWAFDNEGEDVDFLLVPGQNGSELSVDNPGFTGVVTVKPTVIGGTAKQYATFTVSLPCVERPVKFTGPAGMGD